MKYSLSWNEKTMTKILTFRYLLLSVCLMIAGISRAQQPGPAAPAKTTDTTAPKSFVEIVRKLAARETDSNTKIYKQGRLNIAQNRTIEAIRLGSQRVRLYMKDALDTVQILKYLAQTNRSLAIAKEGVLINKGSIQTQRNLAVTSTIISELLSSMLEQKTLLDKYTAALINFKDNLDSLSGDPALFTLPPDSASIMKYVKKLNIISLETLPVDSILGLAVANAQELQLRVDFTVNELRSVGEDLEIYRSSLASGVLDRELSNIWGPAGLNRPVGEIMQFSKAKEGMVLGFYVKEHSGRIAIIFLLIALAVFFIRSVKKMLDNQKMLNTDFKDQLVLKYPVLTSIFVVLNIFQFIFVNPPFIFSFCIAAICIGCLTFIFRETVAPYWLRFWWVVIIFFFLASANNFLLQASRPERWFMLILSAAGVALISFIFIDGRAKELKERGLLYFFVFVGLAEGSSFMLNIFGRFNFSKSLLITGYVGIAWAILFFWTIRLINEMLGLSFKVYKFPDRKLFYINFDKVGTEVPGLFYFFLVIGWFVITGRNFYAFKQLAEPVENFLTKIRTVGEFNFSIGGIFIFLLILLLSVLISRIISFFASTPQPAHGSTKGDRIGVGSWLLLIRIFIISVGIFLAFAATGIAIDRLTIILGALSVGIGLGLQSLVTNLVSGLIIAFEKPVNVGDLLEVNGKIATMKSIGFRSSVARLSDGSHMVIPNGDVLNQHLVNWTMGKNIRKMSVVLGLAYGSNIEEAKKLFTHILETTERVMKNPSPLVIVTAFGPYSIDFELYFWVGHISESDAIKSDVIIRIDSECKKAGFQIPFPQQELTIHEVKNGGQTGLPPTK